jgi:peptidyl-tRNA hydrolase, PTH1 family
MKPSLLIVGLGNPGAQYERTRHNSGFQALDILSEEFGEGDWKDKQKFLSTMQEGRVITAPVFLVKPQTYMNRSGEAVHKLINFYDLDPASQLLVLCDDIDLPIGEVRFREKGGAGTHNGLKSIIEHIGEDFSRMRIGLGEQPSGADLANWVLSVPTKEETELISSAYQKLPEMIREFVMGEGKKGREG